MNEVTNIWANELKSYRIIPYEPLLETDKVSVFKERIYAQLRSLKIAMENGGVNDPSKCQNYINMAEGALRLPALGGKNNKHSVRKLKDDIKFAVGLYGRHIEFLKQWRKRVVDNKLVEAEHIKGYNDCRGLFFDQRITAIRQQTISQFFEGTLTKSESLKILYEYLQEIITDSSIVKEHGIKNSWTMPTLYLMLNTMECNDTLTREKIINCLALPYFKQKNMTVKELKEELKLRIKVLDFFKELLQQYKITYSASVDMALGTVHTFGEYLDLFDHRLEDIDSQLKDIGKSYRLNRFIQGMIERDIWANLYK